MCQFTCASGYADCTASPGCETALGTPEHCADCNSVCYGGSVCTWGNCLCPSGETWCSSSCVDVNVDNSNCGSCGNTCESGSSCVNGLCTCPAEQTYCANLCVYTEDDPAHCGGCDNACPGSQQCYLGTCGECFWWSQGPDVGPCPPKPFNYPACLCGTSDNLFREGGICQSWTCY
ncbi:MAG: hypothetical protein CO108_12875 [Deltaproteobacteria bacterium CG_4_9_14_3_um_filter_63_12]|nr:MAG: hypothetical protein CO108_12875 [Deltaproteobacteria bacterium CG_4_9_14_3_um_filter_63_12]